MILTTIMNMAVCSNKPVKLGPPLDNFVRATDPVRLYKEGEDIIANSIPNKTEVHHFWPVDGFRI